MLHYLLVVVKPTSQFVFFIDKLDVWELLGFNFTELGINSHFPIFQNFCLLEFLYDLIDSFVPFTRVLCHVLPNICHFGLIFSKIFWKTRFIAQRCWQIDEILSIVHNQQWLVYFFWMNLNVVLLEHVVDHICFLISFSFSNWIDDLHLEKVFGWCDVKAHFIYLIGF